MPLAANSKLGPYEIKSTLGAGGMGEVYRARDSRLNRDVAIKVLRHDSATGSSADLRSRFEREARAVAALNHPNIIAVYDFGVEDGQQYIVSELIEGESLRSLLPGSPSRSKSVPVRRLIEIAAQVADGLAAAHAAGIVHRDLKPENIMIAKDGRAKILDFGLARHSPTPTLPAVPTGSDETFVPPTQNLTSAGAVLGTAAYMSPEQALGQETDYRCDQFSFGLILYEMASGKQAFAKPSSVETMASIVRDEPPPIEEKLPAPLKWIIDRCLHKEPEQRYESTRDLFRDLANLRDHFSDAYSSATFIPVGPTRLRVGRWETLAAVGACCLLLGGLLVYLLKPTGQDIGSYRYTPFASGAAFSAWSPDGKAAAYSAYVDGIPQVFLRYLNSEVPVQLTHEKQRVSVLGWSSDGNHLIVAEDTDRNRSASKKLYSVPLVGGDLDFIMDISCESCDLSRDGKALATFAAGKAPGDPPTVSVSDPIGSPLRTYSPAFHASKQGEAEIAFSPDGTKLLLLQRGDAGKLEVWLLPYPAGGKAPRRVLQRCSITRVFGNSRPISWMPDNRHVVVATTTGGAARMHLWIADTESNDLNSLTTGNAGEDNPAVAPDGQGLLYAQANFNSDVVSLSLADGSAKTLVSTGKLEFEPAWAARIGSLAWVSERSGTTEIWVRTSDHPDHPAVTLADFPNERNILPLEPAVSPNGERLVFAASLGDHAFHLWMMSLAGGSPIRLTNVEQGNEVGASWSPDGSRCAYIHTLGSKRSLMTIRTSGNAAPLELKKDVSDYVPSWSPTGEWITYRDEKGWGLMSPDGKASKFLGKIESPYLAFSGDGKLRYGLQIDENGDDPRRATLFSLDPATLRLKVIKEVGEELGMPSEKLEFSVAPDGKSIACSAVHSRPDLWMLSGYRQPGLWNQIKDAFHLSQTK